MSFIEKIKTEMYDAMKSGEKDKAGTLRTLLAKLKDKEINTRKELSEQDGLTVIKTLVKQGKESVAMYEKANRPELANKEKELKELKRKVELVSGEIIPTMMQEMNISTLKLADGTSVEVKPVYGASILVAKREGAFKWLRDNGLGDIIKNEVTVAFGRDEDIKASDYANLAKGQGYEPVQKLSLKHC